MGLEEGFILEAVTKASEGGEDGWPVLPMSRGGGCTSPWEGGSEKTSWRKGL